MLESITLKNYKSFENETSIEIKPLTILCGVNSSGKSSIIKSLLMMRQTIEKESPYNKLAFMGNLVDNGYFEDIINNSCSEDYFTIQNEFTLSGYSKSSKKRQDMQAYKEINKLYTQILGKGIVEKYKIKHFIKVAKSNRSGILSYIDNNNVIETRIEIKVYDKSNSIIPTCSGFIELKKNEKVPSGREYYLNYQNLPFNSRFESIPNNHNNNFVCYFNNIKLINIYKDGGISSSVLNLKPTIMSLFNMTSMMYTGIRFLAPLRQFPSRFYTITGDVNTVGIYGENAPVLLAKLQDEKANFEMPVPYNDDNGTIKFDFTHYSNEINFIEQVQKWFDYLELGKLGIHGSKGQISLYFSNHNLSDVGFGVSQVIPIIIQGLSMMKDELLLLEQPEIHLHPKMQMQIADFLFSVATSERNIIVETHSDHIINRIVRRCLENPKLIEKVSILFFNKDKKGVSNITPIHIDSHLGINNAPIDFFDQYSAETERIIQSGYENMIKDNQR